MRYLVEVQGYGPGDGLSAQLAAHLHRHREHIIKGKIKTTDLSEFDFIIHQNLITCLLEGCVIGPRHSLAQFSITA